MLTILWIGWLKTKWSTEVLLTGFYTWNARHICKRKLPFFRVSFVLLHSLISWWRECILNSCFILLFSFKMNFERRIFRRIIVKWIGVLAIYHGIYSPVNGYFQFEKYVRTLFIRRNSKCLLLQQPLKIVSNFRKNKLKVIVWSLYSQNLP